MLFVSWWYVISVLTDVIEVCHVVNVMVTCHGYTLYVIEVCHGEWCHGDISLVYVMRLQHWDMSSVYQRMSWRYVM